MINKMLGTKKTVASVMTVFNKTIDDLKQVQIEHEAIAERKHEAAQQALSEANAAAAEAITARDMGTRLNNLLSMKPSDFTAAKAA